MLCDIWIASFNSGNVKGLLEVLELYDLNLRLCFSALCLKVKNSQLAFLSDLVWFGWVGFYGISTFLGYLTPCQYYCMVIPLGL